jgi:hypothetical protein
MPQMRRRSFSRLYEELGLLPGNLAPRQQEHLVHLACFMPFDKVAQIMEELLSVQTHEETVHRLTEQVGSWMEAAQTAEVEADCLHESEGQPPLQRCVFSADGAMISLVKKQWAETRTVAVGEPQEKRNADGETEIHVGQLSYFSRLADAFTFTHLAQVELQRRSVAQAKEVCAVMDGADLLQFFTDKHRPDALRILDFPHAAEHLTQLLEALEKAGMHFPPHMLDRCLHIFKHRSPRLLLRMADRLERNLAQQKGVQEHLDYLRKREMLVQYPQFRRDGWPIGSGMMESANKNVVEARLKGTGMHWERSHVNPMLALRTVICNERWQELWQQALTHHRKRQALHRSARVKPRTPALPSGADVSSQASPPASSAAVSEHLAPPAPSPPPVPEASQPSSCRLSSRRKRQRVNCYKSSDGNAPGAFQGPSTQTVLFGSLSPTSPSQAASDDLFSFFSSPAQTRGSSEADALACAAFPSSLREEGRTDVSVWCSPQTREGTSTERILFGPLSSTRLPVETSAEQKLVLPTWRPSRNASKKLLWSRYSLLVLNNPRKVCFFARGTPLLKGQSCQNVICPI